MTTTDTTTSDVAGTMMFNYDQWRERFLNVVLWVVCVFSIILIVPNIPTVSKIELIAFGTIYLSLIIVTITPSPYHVKAGTVIVAGYFAGLYTLVRFGPWSDATIFFLVAVILATLLYDNYFDRWVFAFSAIGIIVISTLNIAGRFNVMEQGLPPVNSSIWLTYIVDYLALATISLWAITLLKNEFKRIAEQFKTALIFANKNRADLEQHVNERTTILTKKSEQLRTVSYITRQTAEAQDLASVLDLVVNLVTDQFGFYHAGIFLMNEAGNEVILQSASSDGGKRMIQKGHSFRVGEKSIVGFTVAEKKTRIALDVGTDAVFFNNPDLPTTRSEMALPLLFQDRVLGVIDIQSEQPQAFSVDDIDVLQALADQVANSIENMRLLEEAQTALMQIETLTTVRTRDAWYQKMKEGRLAYSYTPLGMQASKILDESDNTLNIPVHIRGQKIGSISLVRKNNVPWNKIDIDMITEIAYQTGLAVDNVRLVEDATERARQEQTVGELATRFSQSTDIDSLLQIAARELGQVADVAEVSVFISQTPEQTEQKNRNKPTSN